MLRHELEKTYILWVTTIRLIHFHAASYLNIQCPTCEKLGIILIEELEILGHECCIYTKSRLIAGNERWVKMSQVICRESWRRVKSQNTGTPEERQKCNITKSHRNWSCPLCLIWFICVRYEHLKGIGQISDQNQGWFLWTQLATRRAPWVLEEVMQTPWSCQYGGRTSRWHSSLSFNSCKLASLHSGGGGLSSMTQGLRCCTYPLISA